VLDSLSRLMSSVCSADHLTKSKALRVLLASYTRSEDLIRIGAYQKGFDAVLDRAVEVLPELNKFLQQHSNEKPLFPEVVQGFKMLAS
jgi:flagellum-specific ATP synthase